ncbi:MAG: glycosyltransferase family 2 protein [Bacteroidia bacterium]|nr:glycosyltransferase family 2 protein [Bacteroidia bacterium]
MQIAVVILNWNGKSLLEQFLPSVVSNTPENVQIIVADNNSTDDSVAFVKSTFPNIEIIINDNNYGYAQGYNEALKHVKADVFVLLNSDVEVSKGWIEEAEKVLSTEENIAALQPKILSFKNKDEFEYAGAGGGFIDRYGFPFCRGRIFNSLEKDQGQYNDVTEIFWASGACMFIKSKVFFELNGFEDEFFAHMEEIDLCWRIHNAGYKIMVAPNSVIYHVGGGTLKQNSPRKTYLNFRNNLLMLYKNSPAKGFAMVLFKKLILDGVAALKFLFSVGASHFMAVLKAHIYFYSTLSTRKKQRKESVQLEANALSHIQYRKSVVWQYFLKGTKLFKDLNWN